MRTGGDMNCLHLDRLKDRDGTTTCARCGRTLPQPIRRPATGSLDGSIPQPDPSKRFFAPK